MCAALAYLCSLLSAKSTQTWIFCCCLQSATTHIQHTYRIDIDTFIAPAALAEEAGVWLVNVAAVFGGGGAHGVEQPSDIAPNAGAAD